MCEKLAKKLRNVGFDTKLSKVSMKAKETRNQVFKVCIDENRVFITSGKLGEVKTDCLRYRLKGSDPDQ